MSEPPSVLRIASQWLLGAILAVLLTGLFLAITAVQLTSQDTGQRILRRAIADTTQIDAILPAIQTNLRAAAQDSTANQVRVPDFPIPVDLTRDDALRLRGDELRARLLDQAARRLYQDGTSAWSAADPDADQDIEPISTAGALHRGLGLITEDNHDRILITASVLGFLSIVLAAVLLSAVRSYARLIALGAVLLAAALPSLAGAVAIRFGLRTAEEEADPFVTGLLRLGVDSMWVPLRNYLAFSSLGFAVLALGVFLLWWQARHAAAQPGLSSDASA